MRDATIVNGCGSTPSAPTNEGDASNTSEELPISPEHEGYVLLDNNVIDDSDSGHDEDDDISASPSDLLDDSKVDEALRHALNSDGCVFGAYPASVRS